MPSLIAVAVVAVLIKRVYASPCPAQQGHVIAIVTIRMAFLLLLASLVVGVVCIGRIGGAAFYMRQAAQ